jgi:hypothetical protein
MIEIKLEEKILPNEFFNMNLCVIKHTVNLKFGIAK